MTFQYDVEGRLSKAWQTGAPTNGGVYGYDAMNRLASRTATSGSTTATTLYVHDINNHIIAETNTAGQTLREYIWLNDLPVAVVEGVNTASPTVYYVHSDHLSRPARMTAQNQSWAWDVIYDPFGNFSYSWSNPEVMNIRFPGQWFQLETGLAYNWHRHYDATLGRYVQPDPLGLTALMSNGPSAYGYVGGNPLAYSDLMGLTWGDNVNMFWQWVSGTAPPNSIFGPGTDQSNDMMQSQGVRNAIDYFNKKNAGKCPDKWLSVTNYNYSFGLNELLQAGTNSTQQFVGSFSTNIYPNSDGTITVNVYNTTSLTSFLYGKYPNAWNPPNGYPFGNTSQEFVGIIPGGGQNCGCPSGN